MEFRYEGEDEERVLVVDYEPGEDTWEKVKKFYDIALGGVAMSNGDYVSEVKEFFKQVITEERNLGIIMELIGLNVKRSLTIQTGIEFNDWERKLGSLEGDALREYLASVDSIGERGKSRFEAQNLVDKVTEKGNLIADFQGEGQFPGCSIDFRTNQVLY